MSRWDGGIMVPVDGVDPLKSVGYLHPSLIPNP